jgi:8-oxo-dGTP diphosphatase
MTTSPGPADCVEIAVAVVRNHRQFLVGLRPAGASLAGYWEFPGGKIQVGETPEQAAVRECLEETGLPVRAAGRYPDATHEYSHATVHLHFIACTPFDILHCLPARFRWVTPEELPRYEFPPANAALIEHLVTSST